MYILGIDGGGTKTHCYVGDTAGNVLGEGFGGQGNYQTCGIHVARASIEEAILSALANAEVSLAEVLYAVFGLAGADEAVDFEVLEPLCKDIMGPIPHKVINDTWIGLRSGSDYGVVSICGTGGAHAAMRKTGEQLILRNLDYILGNRGGGGDIVEAALHYAFRSNEGTYEGTALEAIMPEVFGVTSMDEVCSIIRKEDIPQEAAYRIPIETFRLADEGDRVSAMIIEEMANAEGQYAAGVIRRLGMEDEEVPCVLIGSLFATEFPILIDAYIKEVRKAAPRAYTVIPKYKPVMGALLLAIDALDK